MSRIIDFLAKVAALETGEEQDGHASGADTIAILDQLILDARVQLVAQRESDSICGDGVEIISSMRDLMDGAVGFLPPDCGMDVAIKSADDYLKARREADKICPEGISLIREMSGLIDDAIDVHIYHHDDEVPDDCRYYASVAAAEVFLKAHELIGTV